MNCSSSYTYTKFILCFHKNSFDFRKYSFDFELQSIHPYVSISCVYVLYLSKLILELIVKNINISSYMYIGSYPYTLCFKSVLISCFRI